MAKRKKYVSGDSLEARLEELRLELLRLGASHSLPAAVSEDGAARDRLALDLLRIYHQHALPHAYELLLDVAAADVAHIVETCAPPGCDCATLEDAIVGVFLQLYEGKGFSLRRGPHSLKQIVLAIAPSIVARSQETRGIPARGAKPPREDGKPLSLPQDQSSDSVRPLGLPPEEVKRIVERSYQMLPELTRRCFDLYFGEGRSELEIAEELGIPLNGVSTRIQQARLQSYRMAVERAAELGLETEGWAQEDEA
ncbi:MAG: sigma factor-like helix-turn-helix DNA-binding protein [Planctomycetota bacterium]